MKDAIQLLFVHVDFFFAIFFCCVFLLTKCFLVLFSISSFLLMVSMTFQWDSPVTITRLHGPVVCR